MMNSVGRERITPFTFSSHTDYLIAVRDKYGQRQKPISFKKWAERLGYRSSRSLELFFSGARLPSSEFLLRVARDLKLTVKEQHYLDLMVRRERLLRQNKSAIQIEDDMKALRPLRFEAQYICDEIFRRVSEWYPIVIRQLTMSPEFRNDIAWISKKLRGKANYSQIITALAEWAGHAFDRRGLYTSEDVPSEAIRTYHKRMLRKAIEAVDEVDVLEREYIAITFRSHKEKIDMMKRILRETKDQLNDTFSEENGKEVFQLCIALFPHTDLKK